MGNNKMVKIALAVMLVTIVAVSLVSGTYAKYISKASGTDTVTVAKWDIKAGAKNGELSIYTEDGSAGAVTFDLFNTIMDTDKTATEGDVETNKIAPGTAGSFELSIKNDSEVTAKYAIKYTVTNASNIPLEFKVGDGEWSTSLADVAASADTTMIKKTSASVIVDWRWAFHATDAQDTTDTVLGHNAPSVTIKADLTVEQVD